MLAKRLAAIALFAAAGAGAVLLSRGPEREGRRVAAPGHDARAPAAGAALPESDALSGVEPSSLLAPERLGARREDAAALAARLGLPPASLAEPPASLQGTDPDGSLEADERGEFRATADTRRLFDYFLLALGEEPLDVIRGRIVLQIAASLSPPAQQQAIDALDRYLGLIGKLDSLRASGAEQDRGRQLEKLGELRRAEFGPELAEIFYGEDERLARFELGRRAVLADKSLAASEREARLRELERSLPEPLQREHQRAEAPARFGRAVEELRAAGAPTAEIFSMRERTLGREEAERLAAVDAERAGWEKRWSAYRPERDALLADAALGGAERSAALEELRRSHFEGAELEQVRFMDSLLSLQASGGTRPQDGPER